MARGSATVTVQFLGESRGLSSEIGKVESRLAGFGDRFDQVGSKMTDFGSKMSKGVTLPVVAGFALMTNAASDLAEATNVTGLIFDQSRAKIDAFAENAAESLGQSERAAREATATFGGLLQNLGLTEQASADWSMTLTTLASDLGSAFNKDPAVAVEAIGAAVRGETEPIRQFNVQLDAAAVAAKAVELGLADSTAEVSNSAKAQATLALIMEQTSKVQGDFANTSEGLANQQRILKAKLEDTAAEMGAKLLPIALNLVDGLSGLVDGFSNLDPQLQTVILGAAGVAAAIGPIASIAGNASKGLGAMADAARFLATSQSAAAVAATGLGAAVVGAAALWTAYQGVLSAARQDQEEYNTTAALSVNTAALFAQSATQVTKSLQDQAVQAYINAGALGKNEDAMELARANAEVLGPQIDIATTTLKNMARESGVTAERIVQLANDLGVNLGAASEEGTEKLAAAVAQISEGVTPTERLEDVTEELGNEFATSSEKVSAFEEALDSLLGSQLTAEEAQIRLREKTADLAAAVAEGARADETAAEFRDRLALETIGVTEAVRDEVEALVRNEQVSADAAAQQAALRDRLTELRDRFPGLRDQIQVYIDKLNSIPVTKETTIKVDASGVSETLRGVIDQLNRIPRTVATQVVVTGGAGAPLGKAVFGGKAASDPLADEISRNIREMEFEAAVFARRLQMLDEWIAGERMYTDEWRRLVEERIAIEAEEIARQQAANNRQNERAAEAGRDARSRIAARQRIADARAGVVHEAVYADPTNPGYSPTIIVEDRSGNPVRTAREVQLALRVAV